MTTPGVPLPLGTVLEHPCPDCGSEMVLRQSRYGLFYGCVNFPTCRSAHGAHSDGRPLGIPASAPTKKARIEAHAVFDQLWKSGHMKRSAAYRWLQDRMGLHEDEAHIGRFTLGQCERLKVLVKSYLEQKGGVLP